MDRAALLYTAADGPANRLLSCHAAPEQEMRVFSSFCTAQWRGSGPSHRCNLFHLGHWRLSRSAGIPPREEPCALCPVPCQGMDSNLHQNLQTYCMLVKMKWSSSIYRTVCFFFVKFNIILNILLVFRIVGSLRCGMYS